MDWISVEERLPEAGINVLVAFGDGSVFIARYHMTGEWIAATGSSLSVSHWMSLPIPPDPVRNALKVARAVLADCRGPSVIAAIRAVDAINAAVRWMTNNPDKRYGKGGL